MMDCDNSLCSSTRKGLFSIQREFTCAICHELFVRASTLTCSHSFCERCIMSWMRREQNCPTCRKPIERKPVHSIALDNAVGKLVELRVESFAERSKKKNSERDFLTRQSECCTQTSTQTSPQQSPPRDTTRNKSYTNVGPLIRHFFHPKDGGPCHEFHFFNSSRFDEFSDDDYDDYFSDYSWEDDEEDDDYYEDYNGLPGYYWGGYGCCHNCGDPFHWANGCPQLRW